MTVEEAILDYLGADGYVGGLVGAHIYQFKLPQKPTLPAICVQLIDEPKTYHLRGGHRLTKSRVQIDAYAQESSGTDPYTTAADVADAVDGALSGVPPFSVGSPASIEILGVFRQSRRPLYEAEELRQVRMLQDYFVWSRAIT